jgi:type III restriction enzyme
MTAMIAPQLPFAWGDGQDDGPLFANVAQQVALPTLQVDVPADKPLPAQVQAAIDQGQASLSTDGKRQLIQWRGAMPDTVAQDLAALLRGKPKEQLSQSVERHNAVVQGALAPCNRGEVFALVPRLAYRPAGEQGELQLLERESVTEELDLNLLAEPVSLAGFHMAEQGTLWEVYLDGTRLRVGKGDAEQLPLDAVSTTISEDDLARWLAAELQHPSRNVARDVLPAHLRAFVLATVRHLINDQRIPLAQLARHQYPLMQKLALRIEELRDKAAKTTFTQLVLDGGWALETTPQIAFVFEANRYPVPTNKLYRGKFKFSKHFYPVPADLEDGGDEWRCALAIDEHPKVKRWVRNLDSDPVAGFWLPTSSGRFYPDFVCELTDGRVLVVEYKGDHISGMAKEIEKGQVGNVWAERSGGQALFAMVFKNLEGMNMTQQLGKVIG